MISRLSQQRRGFFLLLLSLIFITFCNGQSSSYFQQDVNYTIDATYTYPDQLVADVEINYTNLSNNNLDTIYFHLWMNALSNKASPFADQLLAIGDRSFYLSQPNHLGGYQYIDVEINKKKIPFEYKDENKEIAFLPLPVSLSPGNTLSLNIKYELKIPFLFTRMGYNEKLVKLIHWYPRVAVYDNSGWNLMPYLVWGEYYGEYANFEINFTSSDSSLVVMPFTVNNFNIQTIAKAKSVIDFPIMIYHNKDNITSDSINYKGVKISAHYYRDPDIWSKATQMAKDAIDFYTEEIGMFPYPEISITQGAHEQESAMEYPGLIVINNIKSLRELDYYIAHEIAHQYFYASLGFNERNEPYLDEGLATFYESQYTLSKYGSQYYNSLLPKYLEKQIIPKHHVFWLGCKHQSNRNMNQPLATAVQKQTAINYGLNNYQTATQMFFQLQSMLGNTEFRLGMKAFYQKWKENHPSLHDLIVHFEKTSRIPMEWINESINQNTEFDLKVNKSGLIRSSYDKPFPLQVLIHDHNDIKDTVVTVLTGRAFIPNFNSSKPTLLIDPYGFYKDQDRKNNKIRTNKLKLNLLPRLDDQMKYNIYNTPFVRFNTSDQWMPSIAIYNSSFPSKKLKWMLAPAYSITNKALRGDGFISYDFFYKKGSPSYLKPILSYKNYAFEKNSKFGYDLAYNKLKLGVQHINVNKTSPKKINTTEITYSRISEQKVIFTSSEEYSFKKDIFNIIELKNIIDNKNALYPSTFETKLQYLPKYNVDDHFLKLESSYSVQMFFDENKYFGLRIWGSYFIANTKRKSLSFNNGIVKGSSALSFQSHSDYNYDYYFLDRNKNEINQSMIAGGGFKNIFNGNRNIGQSNDFAVSTNLTSDIPLRLPKFLPIKLFLDLGLYNQPSLERSNNIKYLYSGGISLNYFNNILQINLPFLNSKEINQIYREENSFLKRVSFSLNLNKLNFWNKIDQFNHYF